MKKILIGGIALVVVLGGAAVIAPAMIDWSAYKSQATDAIESATGYRARIEGDIAIRLLPYPAVKLNDVEIRLPDAPQEESTFKAKNISAALALFPLFSGQVAIKNISLGEPQINLRILPNGEFQVSPKVGDMLGYVPAATSGEDATDVAPVSSMPVKTRQVSIDYLAVEDGRVVIIDTRSGKTHKVEKLGVDMGMGGIMGPFYGDVAGIYNGIKFDLSGKAGDMQDASADVPIGVEIKLPDQSSQINFAGAFSRRADGDAQGTLEVEGDQIGALIQKLTGASLPFDEAKLDFKSLVSATPRNIVFDQIDLRYDRVQLNGIVKTRLADQDFPRAMVEAKLQSKDVLDLRPWLASAKPAVPVAANGQAAGGKKTESKKATTTLPVDLNIEWQAGGIQVGPEAMKDVALSLKSEKGEIRGRMIAAQLPGQGRLDLTAFPGTGNIVSVQGEASIGDPAMFMSEGLGMPPPPSANAQNLRDLRVKSLMQLDLGGYVHAENGTATWQGGELSFSGSAYDTRGKHPRLTLDLSGALLDLDRWFPPKKSTGKEASSGTSGPAMKEMARAAGTNFQIPFDLDLRADFAQFKAMGYDMRDVVAKARVTGDGLKVEQLSIGAVDGASVQGSGAIQNLRSMSGMDVKLNVAASDGQAFLQKWAPEQAKQWPGKTSPLKLNATYQGDLDQAQLAIKGEAMGVGLALAGPVRDPLGSPQMEQININVSASHAVDALRLVQPKLNSTASLQKPLQLSAVTTIKGKVYNFKNISGEIAGMSVKGDVNADYSGARPNITGGLNLGEVPLDALMGVERRSGGGDSAGSGGNAAPAASTNNARWSSEAIDTAWMRDFDADFAIAANRVTYNLWSLGDTNLQFTLRDGAFKTHDVRAKVFNGSMSASLDLAAPKSNGPLAMNAALALENVNARSLTNALMNKNINRVDGTLGMKIDVQGNGTSPMQLISNLNGSASSNGQNVTLNGIDVAKLVAWLTTDLKPSTTVQGLMGSFMGSGATTFEQHKGLYTIKNGQVLFDQMVFDGAQANLDTDGMIDLPAWRVDTKTTLQVKTEAKNVPPLTFTFKGPLDRPTQNMVGNLFESYLQQQLGKQVNKLLEKKLGNKLNDLGLGGLLGGKAAPQAPATPEPMPQEVAPATENEPSSEATPVAPAPEEKHEIKPEDVLLDVLKGLGN